MYILFDVNNWRRERKDLILNFDELDTRPSLMQGAGLASAGAATGVTPGAGAGAVNGLGAAFGGGAAFTGGAVGFGGGLGGA
jgi:CCR4-NOT transcription complex subunit 2